MGQLTQFCWQALHNLATRKLASALPQPHHVHAASGFAGGHVPHIHHMSAAQKAARAAFHVKQISLAVTKKKILASAVVCAVPVGLGGIMVFRHAAINTPADTISGQIAQLAPVAVPEPSSLAIMAMGLAVMLIVRRAAMYRKLWG